MKFHQLLLETIQYEYQCPDDIEKAFYDFYIFYDWYNILNRIKPGNDNDLSIKKIVYEGIKECAEFQRNLIFMAIINGGSQHTNFYLDMSRDSEERARDNKEEIDKEEEQRRELIEKIISITPNEYLYITSEKIKNYINDFRLSFSKNNLNVKQSMSDLGGVLDLCDPWDYFIEYYTLELMNEQNFDKLLFLIDKLYHEHHTRGFLMEYAGLKNIKQMLDLRRDKNPEDYVHLSSIPRNIFDKINQEFQ